MPDGRALTVEELPGARALRGERVTGLELLVQRPDGRTGPILANAAPVESGGTTPTEGAVVAIYDITPLKELERQRAEWSAVIAHDLRQPVNAIGIHTQLLARRPSLDDDARESVQHIRALNRRLNRMVQDLLDLSRLDSRQFELMTGPVEIGALVKASVDDAALGAPDRPFQVRIASDLPALEGDADRLTQVLDNLLSNAVKYGRAETPITVTAERVGGAVSIAITNVGATIPAEELQSLFQRFRRTEGARQSRVKGVGLGLYISRALVEAHRGTLGAESREGMITFRLTLPFREEARLAGE
jgi:signal transduction histidine kinase